ncbi:MAG TPA: phage tail terminator-like protein [Phycisphaerae bacterium]|nr:phage tail terminator-like protein [Phycisphaerae bacterium]
MSVSYLQVQRALRAQLITLSVATTGAINMSATTTAYVRAAGSFLTDGFYAGMEIVAAGMTVAGNNGVAVVKAVSALTLTVTRTLGVEVAAAGKTLTVGLPAGREWENEAFAPTTGSPYVEEELVPGPAVQITLGKALGWLELTPLYIVRVNVPEGVGTDAVNAYTDALLKLFKPHSTMTLANGDVLRVRGDPAPYRGQSIQRKSGWATVPVTIPLRMTTINS